MLIFEEHYKFINILNSETLLNHKQILVFSGTTSVLCAEWVATSGSAHILFAWLQMTMKVASPL